MEKKAPTDWGTVANGGTKPGRALGWNPAKGHRGYISTSGVVSVNPKKHQFANCRGQPGSN